MDVVNGISAVLLARMQFAANITFHILFPTITIALGWVLLYFKLRHNHEVRDAKSTAGSHQSQWLDAYRFWIKVFALSFAIGVVTGVTMSFQFGTNWPGYMNTVGNIAGPFLAYEILTAFFMEATFLSVLLFGMNRVSNRVHTVATILVAVGTTLSAFWILALNSWMQTPSGFEMRDGVAHATSWLQVLFNPSMPYRITHMLLACGITVSFLLMGLSSYRWLRGDHGADVMAALRTGAFTAAVLVPLQIVAGDLHGLNTLHYQPAKIAAMEGLWDSTKRAPAVLFAWPDETTHRNRYEIAIPDLASLYLTHGFNEEIKGLNEFDKHPPVAPVFFAFRIMVGMGVLMLMVAWTVAWQLRKRSPPSPLPQRERSEKYSSPPRAGEGREGALRLPIADVRNFPLKPWLLRLLVLMSFSGWVALVAGWYTTEIGRQPYIVYGVLLTADAAAPIARPLLAFSLSMYLSLYAVLIVSYISVVFYMARKANPAAGDAHDTVTVNA
jgi:cytochrome d ubiquinol oxidase subunit I